MAPDLMTPNKTHLLKGDLGSEAGGVGLGPCRAIRGRVDANECIVHNGALAWHIGEFPRALQWHMYGGPHRFDSTLKSAHETGFKQPRTSPHKPKAST